MNNLPQKPTGNTATAANVRRLIEGVERTRPVISQSGVRVSATTQGVIVSPARRGRSGESKVIPTWL